MLRYLSVFLATFIFSDFLWSQMPSSAISFDERVYDFGNIVEKNGKVSHTFVFHNKGKVPVVVSNIYSGCGCIGQVVSKDPVKPGGKGRVVISFNPDYKSGFFSKEIVVYSDNGQNYNRIWVQGIVTPSEHPVEDDYPYNFGTGLYLRLKVMAFGYLKPGETKQMDLHYANETDKPMLLNFVVAGKAAGLKFVNPGKITPKAKGVVSFSFTMPPGSKNDVVFIVYPYVNNKKLDDNIEVKILNEIKLRPVSATSKGN
ncbi:MAG: DUF1573 domain-containing protein [Flavisolibacter sp.]